MELLECVPTDHIGRNSEVANFVDKSFSLSQEPSTVGNNRLVSEPQARHALTSHRVPRSMLRLGLVMEVIQRCLSWCCQWTEATGAALMTGSPDAAVDPLTCLPPSRVAVQYQPESTVAVVLYPPFNFERNEIQAPGSALHHGNLISEMIYGFTEQCISMDTRRRPIVVTAVAHLGKVGGQAES